MPAHIHCQDGPASAARDHRDHPARQVVQEPIERLPARMARRPRATSRNADRAVPRHASRRARRQRRTRSTPTGATSRIFPPISKKPEALSPRADSDELRGHLARLGKRGLAPATTARRLSAIRQLYRFLYSEGHRADDPAAVLQGPKRGRSLPKVLSIKQVDELLAQARERDDRPSRNPNARAARLDLPARSALRHRPAGLRAGGIAGGGGAARPAHAGGPRQGRPRAAGAAQRRRQARHDGLSGAARPRRSWRNPNGCSRRLARAGTSAASISPAN